MIAIGIIPGSDIMNCVENVTIKQATYLQMNDTHTTHWSAQYSVYMDTSYTCIKVALEYNAKDLQSTTR